MTARKCNSNIDPQSNIGTRPRAILSQKRMFTALAFIFLIQDIGLYFSVTSDNAEISSGFAAQAVGGRRGKHTQAPAEEHFNSGKAKLTAEDLDGAIDAFLQATYFARNGYYPEAYYWLGISYMEKNDKNLDNKAVEALEKHVSQSVEEPTDAYLALAEIHLRNKRWEECENAVKSIKKYDPKTTQKVQYIYGLMEDRKGDDVTLDSSTSWGGALGQMKGYQKARELEQKQSQLSLESRRRGHYMAAEQHFRQALGDKPWSWTKVWLLYCEEKMKLQKWAEALRELMALKTSHSIGNQMRMQPARLHKDIGLCKLALGDHQGAMDHWRFALDYNKDDYEVFLQIAMLLETEHHFSSAVKYYKDFLRLREGSDDKRVSQVRDRLTSIEHMLTPNEAAPGRVKPSPYMREEMAEHSNRENQQNDQQRRQQKIIQQRQGDSGF
ncbi:MAG: hypothetical protein SGJ27_10240 [Candidatus Melainabacteria bacterium]|nr:hypothetical protein [Candidatus Melainabacteria bacterium]